MADAIETIAVLAGGLATRMLPLTHTLPKALLDVAGQPFIAHQLRLLKREGLKRVVLCVAHLGQQIEDHVGNGSRFGLEIIYSYDGETLAGTGGAILKALPLLDDPFFVTYGDSYLDTDYQAVARSFRGSQADALMTVFRNEGKWDTSNVVFENNQLLLYSKRHKSPDMDFIDYGLGVVTRRAMRCLGTVGAFDLADVYEKLSQDSKLAGYEVHNRFYEIGSQQGMRDLDARLRTGPAATQPQPTHR